MEQPQSQVKDTFLPLHPSFFLHSPLLLYSLVCLCSWTASYGVGNGWLPDGTTAQVPAELVQPSSFPLPDGTSSSAQLLHITNQYTHPPYLEQAMAKDFAKIRRLTLQDNIRAANGIVKRACMRLGNCSLLQEVIWIDPWKGFHFALSLPWFD